MSAAKILISKATLKRANRGYEIYEGVYGDPKGRFSWRLAGARAKDGRVIAQAGAETRKAARAGLLSMLRAIR